MGDAHGVDMALIDDMCDVGGGRGSVSSERVRRQDARTIEKDAAARGSCVEMYSSQWSCTFMLATELLSLERDVTETAVAVRRCDGRD